MMPFKYIKSTFFLLALLFIASTLTHAAPFKSLPVALIQPDGDTIHLYASGDEYYNWLHDEKGYTVMQGADGYYYYAEQSGEELVPSSHRVDQTDPATLSLTPWLKKKNTSALIQKAKSRINEATENTPPPLRAPHKGKMNNIIIYISFNDQPEFTTPRSFYDNQFNNPSGPSLKHYYTEVSYNKLRIESSHFPVCGLSSNLSYKDSKNRSYFMTNNGGNTAGYNPNDDAEIMTREHALIVRALTAMKSQIESNFSASDLDADGDGNVDNVWFIINGSFEGWGGLLWAHRWALYSVDFRLHGKRVYDYVFQPENQVAVRTSCHEMFHSLGAPDLYHYSYDGFTPVGLWDLMEDSDAHMSAYMKWKYTRQNWIPYIPEITCSGTYTLRPLTDSVNNCYKIPLIGEGNEFLILEYRRTQGLYESTLPGSGLLIYRINPSVKEGNRNGPPDEVYIYRPGGDLSNDGDIYSAFFSVAAGRTAFDLTTNPRPFKSNGSLADISITQIEETDTTLTFTVGGLPCQPSVPDSLSLISYVKRDSVCQGTPAWLSCQLKDGIGPYTYEWAPLPAGSFLIQNATTSAVTVPTTDLAPGTYRMALTLTDQGEVPPRVIQDTVNFVIWELPAFTISPQTADYCLTKQQVPLNNIRFDYSLYCNMTQNLQRDICTCLYRPDLIEQGYNFEFKNEPCWVDPALEEALKNYFASGIHPVLGAEILLSTENGVLGGTPPYTFLWNRCSNASGDSIDFGSCIPLRKLNDSYSYDICGIYTHPQTGEKIEVSARTNTNQWDCAEGSVCARIGWNVYPADAEKATATLLPGCNCFSLTVRDAHGCSSQQTIHPVGHHFQSKSISIANPPLGCGKQVLLKADAFCPGSECTDCFKNCHCSTFPYITWGPTSIVSGSGRNAQTIPLSEPTTIWAVFIDPVTGCSDTLYKTLNITCSEPSIPTIKLQSATFCDNELPATITATVKGTKGPCTYQWSTTWGDVLTTNTPTLTIPANVKNCHTIQVTLTDNGYSPAQTASAQTDICISGTPDNFTISADRSEVCLGDTVLLQASSYGNAGLYQWQATGGHVTDHWDGTATGKVLASPCTFTLVASGNGADADKCKRTVSKIITGHSPTAQITPVSGFECGNMQGTLNASGSSCSQGDAIVSYEWGPAGAYSTTSGTSAVTLPVTTNTTFYVDIKDAFGCVGHAEVTISDGICNIDVKGDTLCVYDGVTNQQAYAFPRVTVLGGTPKIQWKSVSASLPDSRIITPSSAQPEVYIAGLAAGDYPIAVDISDGVTTQTYQTTIRLLNAPQVKITANDTLFCVGEEIRLSSTVVPGGVPYKYYWLNGASGPEAGTTATANLGSPGTANFVLKITNPYGCFGYDTVSVKALSEAHLCAHTECTGSSVYEAQIEISGATWPYFLYKDAALTQLVTDTTWNTAHNYVQISGLSSGQAYIFYLNGPQLCKTSEIEVFQDCDCYAGAFLSCDTLSCESTVDTLPISINTWGAAFYSFDLQAPDGSIVLSVRKSSEKHWIYPAIRPLSGTYTLINFKGYTNEQDEIGCNGEIYQNAKAIFPEKPRFSIEAFPTELCNGDTVRLTATGISANISYHWTTTQGSLILNPDSTTTQAIANPGLNTYTLTADGGNGCITQHSIDITAHRVKAGNILANPAHGFGCNASGTLVLSTAQCSQNNCLLNFRWEPTAAIQSVDRNQITTRPLQYPTTFKVWVTDSLGCSDSTEIFIRTGICEALIQGDTLCEYNNGSNDSLAYLRLLIKGGTPRIQWKDQSGAGLIFDTPNSLSTTVNTIGLAPGNYPVAAEINDGISVTTYTTSIQIVPNPQVSLRPDRSTVCLGEEVNFTAEVLPDNPGYTYYWLNGIKGDEHQNTAKAWVNKAGVHTYILKIENRHGCFAYDSVSIKGLKEAFLCATTICNDEETFRTQIHVLGATPPYQLYEDSSFTRPVTGHWDLSILTIDSLPHKNIYTYYLDAPDLCYKPQISVTKECECKTTESLCEAGIYLEVEEAVCNPVNDTLHIYISAWGAERYSFRLLDPNGATVLTVSNDSANYWTYPVTAEHTGNYTIDGFQGLVLSFDACPGKIFGKALVIFPEQTKIEAGQDKYICLGESVSLSANGNACSFQWNNGIENGQPFTPQQTTTYVVEGTAENGCPAADSITVFVEEPVIITYQSPDITTEKGQNAQFHIQTLSTSPVSYQWQKQNPKGIWERLSDGGNTPAISGTSSQHILLQNLPLSWNNTFLRCIASNRCGSDTAYFNLRINGCTEGGEISLVMEEGIIPDSIEGNYIHGWFCRGVRIGVRAVVNGVHIPKDATFEWTVDGLPVEYSKSEYITWIPAMWEDDIVLKVCIRSNEFCEPLCAPHLRLKSRPFEKPALRIVTSVDPRRIVCPDEIIHLIAAGKNMGKNPDYHWYSDIFHIGSGTVKTIAVDNQDIWIRLTGQVSDEVCTDVRLLTDTLFLKQGALVKPDLEILFHPEDSLVCLHEEIELKASYTDAGSSPQIFWEADIWNWGSGDTKKITVNDKDTWIHCYLLPSRDVCCSQDTIHAYKKLNVIEENPSVVITSDLEGKQSGETICFTCHLGYPLHPASYQWRVNNRISNSSDSVCNLSNLKDGDRVQCFVSGTKSCQQNMASNVITISFDSQRDTSVVTGKNEILDNFSLFRQGDENSVFEITQKATYGTAYLSLEGNFRYIPYPDFIGGDLVSYVIRDKTSQEIIDRGKIYITVTDREKYFIPNIITPNGDGMNDTWIIEFLKDYPEHTLSLYNRNGKLVYRASPYLNDFDGTGQGNGYVAHIHLSNGIYTYVINLGNKIILKSWLEIRRDIKYYR